MTRPVSSPTATEIALPLTRPLFLVELAFSPTVRLSSREQVSWSSYLWAAAAMTLAMTPGGWSVEIFNEASLLGQTVLTQGTSGRRARVWQLHGAGPWAIDDAVLLLDGEMGTAVIGQQVQIALRPRPPQKTPRLYINPPVFNHVPAAGTRIATPGGVVILERG